MILFLKTLPLRFLNTVRGIQNEIFDTIGREATLAKNFSIVQRALFCPPPPNTEIFESKFP